LRSEDGEWRQVFLSVKGALDFIGTMDHAKVIITDGIREMQLVLPNQPSKPGMHPE
jgi:hypothetical protein